MLTVRYPDFDFTDSSPRWGSNLIIEAGTAIGALSAAQLQWVFEDGYDPRDVAPPRDYERVLTNYPSRR